MNFITISINRQYKQKNHQKYTPNHKLSLFIQGHFCFSVLFTIVMSMCYSCVIKNCCEKVP